MNKHGCYTPAVHFRTILCNMLGQGTFNNSANVKILDQIKQECADDDNNMETWSVRHVARAIRKLGLARYLMYKHEIFYIVTGKPRPAATAEQEREMTDYFETHESDYMVGNNYYKFEDIVKDVDEKLGFNVFVNV
jgi:hypothetical protein